MRTLIPFKICEERRQEKPKAHLQWKGTHLEKKITHLGKVGIEDRDEMEFFSCLSTGLDFG